MKDKTLRVLRWRGYRWMREVSMLIREFFTPREIRMMMDDYREEKGYEDYPIDLCRPKMISEKTLKKPSLAIEKNTWFHLGENSGMQMHYCLTRMCDPTLEHVDNNFEPVSERCIEEFRPMRNELISLFDKTRTLLERRRFRDADALRAECDRVKEEFSLTRKRLIDRMQDESESLGANYVYLNILQESQELISAMRHMLRAARNFQTEVNI